jgi:hypothetical protein
MSRIFFYFFRSLLGIYLIFQGLKGLSEIGTNTGKLTTTVEIFQNEILIPFKIDTSNLQIFKQYPNEILYFENLCIIYGGFLMFFGFSLSKAFVFSGFLVDFIFLNNVYFYRDNKTVTNFSLLLSLLGGILQIK